MRKFSSCSCTQTTVSSGQDWTEPATSHHTVGEDEEGEPTNEKTMVFSQFTSMLDIIQIFLKARSIEFVRCTPEHF